MHPPHSAVFTGFRRASAPRWTVLCLAFRRSGATVPPTPLRHGSDCATIDIRGGTALTTPESVLEFWFGDDPTTFEGVLEKLKYWAPTLDAAIQTRFGETIERALAGFFDDWRASHDGTLALTIVLDQFPRHAYRGTARQYAGDARASRLALTAWDDGWPLGSPIATPSSGAPRRLRSSNGYSPVDPIACPRT